MANTTCNCDSESGIYNSEIVIYEEQAEVVKLIFELYSFDQSLSKVSKHLEMYHIPSASNKPLWGRQIINNILSNANYLGDSDYPQIINEELWNAVQNKIILIPCQHDEKTVSNFCTEIGRRRKHTVVW